MCDSCLAAPSFFFSLLRQPPLTKRTKRDVLSCEFSSWGQPTPLPFCPDCGSAMYMWGHLLYRSDCGCVQRTRLLWSNRRRHSKQQLLLLLWRGVGIERLSSFTRPRGNGLHQNQAQSIDLACSFQRIPRLMSWALGPPRKLKTQGVATEYESTTFAQLSVRSHKHQRVDPI